MEAPLDTYSLPRLKFDVDEISYPGFWIQEAQSRMNRLCKWVNRVLRLQKSQTLEEFSVSGPVNQNCKHHVDKWLEYAFSRKVQRLELALGVVYSFSEFYAFPLDLFYSKITPSGFMSIRVASFSYVRFGEEGLAFILSHSPLLERLSICCNPDLLNLKVTEPSLKLKYLEVLNWFNTVSIEVCDVNLVSFKYRGLRTIFRFKNVPFLAEIHIIGQFSESLGEIFRMFSCSLSQIETLMLELTNIEGIKKFDLPFEFNNLKRLKVKIFSECEVSLFGIISLIMAAPYLQEFVYQSSWEYTQMVCDEYREYREVVRSPRPHQHIKKVEFAGYFGRTCELDLAMFFLQNAIALEKVIVVPYSEGCRTQCFYALELGARKRANEQLIGKAPAGVDLVIL